MSHRSVWSAESHADITAMERLQRVSLANLYAHGLTAEALAEIEAGEAHHRNWSAEKKRLVGYLRPIGVNFARFIEAVEGLDTLGWHAAVEMGLHDINCGSLAIEPILSQLAILSEAYFRERDEVKPTALPLAAE